MGVVARAGAHHGPIRPKHETPELLEWVQERFSYDPETGNIMRNERPIEHFEDGPVWDREQAHKKWNSSYAGYPIRRYSMKGYLLTSLGGEVFSCERIAWAIHYGEWPQGKIGFRDRNPGNLALSNLFIKPDKK